MVPVVFGREVPEIIMLSQSFDMKWSVAHGCCLGPLLLTIYTSNLFSILESHLSTARTYTKCTKHNYMRHQGPYATMMATATGTQKKVSKNKSKA